VPVQPARVSAHNTGEATEAKTVFLIKFDQAVMAREAGMGA
jgi:hypothetical protein